ncbi:MAG: hypothetical protein O3A01_02195 [bacterium]|nr:hypothetical protein [bacterium]
MIRLRSLLIIITLTICTISISITHPFFAIKRVHYHTENFVSIDQLIPYGNSLMGKTIFCVLWLGGFKYTLSTQLPAIKTLSIRADFPNGIIIRVTEKEPWVSFVGAFGSIIVAQDGTILNNPDSIVTLEKLEDIIIIGGIQPEALSGSRISSELLAQLTQLVAHIQFYFPTVNLQMEFDSNELMLIKDDRLPIKIGSLENLDIKFRNLKSYLENTPNTDRLEYIDIRVEDRVVVK